ncbi:MAG TPA: superoxide dismutase [Lachnospiraceae bacterium]|jgi:Fe-Mn family superoxide dismutase|nr:superoxide dismutase [Lachnospiraceae bacterium]HCA70118.1 superoxide dismutase [Lachnospiraceae bacterium]HCM12953.1 superoxide dismutase [Lachnospiraceae bacterium]HCR40512.1 superoxide dismutase [Lachnospiraceae bacterium]
MIEKIDFHYTDDITVVNREQFDVHVRLYEGYVNSINKIDEELNTDAGRKEANTTYGKFRDLKRGETYALNGVILHELYFQNIGGKTSEPDLLTSRMISRDFGCVSDWIEDFVATAKASRGWAVLAFEQRSGRFRNVSLDSHDLGNIAYYAPVLVLDMYEHAYFLQYADKKADYINFFMSNINWDVVGERIKF